MTVDLSAAVRNEPASARRNARDGCLSARTSCAILKAMLRRSIVLLSLVMTYAACVRAEPPPSRLLDDAQVARLYAESCLDRPRPYDNNGIEVLLCIPRDYPWMPILREIRCPFFFEKDESGRFGIYYGRFTAGQPQAIVMYQGACEPNAHFNGGMALFDIIDAKFRLVRYYPAHFYRGCIVVAAGQENRDTVFCKDWSIAQGVVGENFGPVRFNADGSAKHDSWYDAGNVDGMLGALTTCDGETKAHHLLELAFDQNISQIVVEAAMREPAVVAEACRRYLAEDFNEEDRARREDNPFRKEFALIRSYEEDAFVKVFIRFDSTNPTPHIEITDQPAP